MRVSSIHNNGQAFELLSKPYNSAGTSLSVKTQLHTLRKQKTA